MIEIVPVSFSDLSREGLEACLSAFDPVRIALVGDLSLDAYWKADMTKSELSRETPHFPLPIVNEFYTPGAGGNVAANLSALKPQSVFVLGVVGQDWRGDVLLKTLTDKGLDSSFVIRHASRVTNAYIKPIRRGLSDVEYEDPRLDFANYTPQPHELDAFMIEGILKLSDKVDVLCVADQFLYGCFTQEVRHALVELAGKGKRIVVDSRYHIADYPGCVLKPNELECANAIGLKDPYREHCLEEQAEMACALSERTGSFVCMTLGARGCLIKKPEDNKIFFIKAIQVDPPIDICGAGDTFMSMLSCALAAGADAVQAAALANLASAVTIKKIGQTGTASREEVLGMIDEVTG